MPDATPHILVVDDDARLRQLLHKYLAENGFRVSSVGDAAEAQQRLEGLAFDLIVLDRMMPGESGVEFARSLRARENGVPILMLTAMGETEDRIAGFEAGVDDYLPKPFEPRELVLRIRTILKRAPTPAPARPSVLQLGPCRFDLAREELHRGEARVRLSQGEARLLKVLGERAGEALDREALQSALGAATGARAIDVQVTRLRRKIEPDPKLPRYLVTVRGRGYALRPD
jgi:two-component system phosphate regulon response regulator OmpR